MSASVDYTNKAAQRSEPVRLVDGGRMIITGAQWLIGGALVLAAIGLWLAPGASLDGDLVLFKLILSCVAAFGAVGFLHATARPRAPDVEIDTIRREVRVVRRQPGKGPHVLQSCAFGNLSAAEFDGSVVKMWDEQDTLLAEVSPKDAKTLRSLVAGLRDEGKLA